MEPSDYTSPTPDQRARALEVANYLTEIAGEEEMNLVTQLIGPEQLAALIMDASMEFKTHRMAAIMVWSMVAEISAMFKSQPTDADKLKAVAHGREISKYLQYISGIDLFVEFLRAFGPENIAQMVSVVSLVSPSYRKGALLVWSFLMKELLAEHANAVKH